MTPDELRALADKVEQGTATDEDVWDVLYSPQMLCPDPYGLHQPVKYWELEGDLICVKFAMPRLLTSIDVQLKYLPMPGWERQIFVDERGVMASLCKWGDGNHGYTSPRINGEAPTEPAARLAAILRAMAWELENGK